MELAVEDIDREVAFYVLLILTSFLAGYATHSIVSAYTYDDLGNKSILSAIEEKCGHLTDSRKAWCIVDYARETGNERVCAHIGDTDKKKFCEVMCGSRMNCSDIDNPKMREMCFGNTTKYK